jgi:hypothetical protein
VFRGLIRWATSLRTVSSDLKKGRSEPEKKLFVPEGVVLDQVKAVLRTIEVPPTLLDALLAHTKAGHGS